MDSLIAGCFVVQKLFGRQPESIDIINRTFHSVLGRFPAEKAVLAFEVWMERSAEFPTPADIANLIKRNGKPPLTESQFIAISRKDGEDRTLEEWQYLRDWKEERDRGWDDDPSQQMASATHDENMRLRVEVSALKAEVAKLGELLHDARKNQKLELPRPSLQKKIDATVEAMRKAGAPETDIEKFIKSAEGAAA